MKTQPVRLQLSRRKGFDLQVHSREINGLEAVVVTRPGKWGNPFDLRRSEHCWTALAHGYRADRRGRIAASVALYRAWLAGGKAVEVGDCGIYAEAGGETKPIQVSPSIAAPVPPTLEELRAALAGKNLACWCKPGDPCHADVLLDLANGTGKLGSSPDRRQHRG